MQVAGGVGDFVSWDGGCLFIGERVGLVPLHSHYAIQVVFGATPGVRLRPDDDAEWTAYDGAIIASRQPHSMDATGLRINGVLFVEPETREGRALSAALGPHGIIPAPATIRPVTMPMFDAFDRRDLEGLATAGRAVIAALTGDLPPTELTDERILRAVRYINQHLGTPLTLEQVAREACLSPGRFRHLFVEQTGMALRPYILWRRFLRVWALLRDGASLSAAAHEAGFADAPHLARTSRRMFGFPPSMMTIR